MTKFDPVQKAQHYNSHPSGLEAIEIVRHMNFCLGNAVKYLWRAELKGEHLKDLEKALWYVKNEYDNRVNGLTTPLEFHVPQKTMDQFVSGETSVFRRDIIVDLTRMSWHWDVRHLQRIAARIQAEIDRIKGTK